MTLVDWYQPVGEGGRQPIIGNSLFKTALSVKNIKLPPLPRLLKYAITDLCTTTKVSIRKEFKTTHFIVWP